MKSLSINRKAAFVALGFQEFDKMVFLPGLQDNRDYIALLETWPSKLGATHDSIAWAFVLAPEDEEKYPVEFISLTVNRKLPSSVHARFSIEKTWRYPLPGDGHRWPLSKDEMLAALFKEEGLIAELYTSPRMVTKTNLELETSDDSLVSRVGAGRKYPCG